ncbi:MAG: HD domain-containing protein, partial [Clostridiales bacterium]|nr:HD domain-containing protein [Clostridiales bacterium]
DLKTRTVVELQSAVLSTMTKLVDHRDDVTGGHIERTQRYMEVLLRSGLTSGFFEDESAHWDLDLIVQSTQLHDVGKIAIKDSILLKPGKLTDDEFEEIKKHTTFGENVIEEIQKNTADHKFLEYAKVFTGTHHEKWDGSGYPRGLKGAEIPILGRTMAIVDVYDALVSDRPYKKGMPHDQAVAIISDGKGKHFDPVLVDLFLSVADQFCAIAA